MTAPRPMTDLEWMGWEVAAAQYLEVWPATAALLRHLIQLSPEIVSAERLAQRTGLKGGGAIAVYMHQGRHRLKHTLQQSREALGDVGFGAGAVENVKGEGYRIPSAMAGAIQSVVEQSVSRAA